MNLLETLGHKLESIAEAATQYTWENSTSDNWTEAEHRTLERSRNIAAVGRVLNGRDRNDNVDYND